MTTAKQRAELRKLADAASALDHNESMNWYSYGELINTAHYPKNVRFMVAATPPFIVALLDDINRLTSDLEAEKLYSKQAGEAVEQIAAERDLALGTIESRDRNIETLQIEKDKCGSGAGCLYKDALIDNLTKQMEQRNTVVKSWLRANSPGGWIGDLRSALEKSNREHCACKFNGDERVEMCELHAAWHDALHGQAEFRRERDAALAELAAMRAQEPLYRMQPDGYCQGFNLSPGHADSTLLPLYAAAGAAPVPDGWKLVPMVATDDMLYAIQENCHILPPRGKRVWAELLAASPKTQS